MKSVVNRLCRNCLLWLLLRLVSSCCCCLHSSGAQRLYDPWHPNRPTSYHSGFLINRSIEHNNTNGKLSAQQWIKTLKSLICAVVVRRSVGRLVDELHTNSEHGVVDEHYAFRQRTFHSKWVEQASSEIYYYGRRHNSKLNSRTADRQAGSVLRDDICDFQAATR